MGLAGFFSITAAPAKFFFSVTREKKGRQPLTGK
jgi:hypothetical protein